MKLAWAIVTTLAVLGVAWHFSADGVGVSPVPHLLDNMRERAHPDAQQVDESLSHRRERLVPPYAVAQRINGDIKVRRSDDRFSFPGDSSYFVSGRTMGGDEEIIPPELGGYSYGKDIRAEGRTLYTAHCAVCHGANGDGKGMMAEYKEYPGVGDFRDSKYDNYTPGKMFRSIRLGQGNMPDFGHVLTAREIWCLVEFIRQMQGGTSNREETE